MTERQCIQYTFAVYNYKISAKSYVRNKCHAKDPDKMPITTIYLRICRLSELLANVLSKTSTYFGAVDILIHSKSLISSFFIKQHYHPIWLISVINFTVFPPRTSFFSLHMRAYGKQCINFPSAGIHFCTSFFWSYLNDGDDDENNVAKRSKWNENGVRLQC